VHLRLLDDNDFGQLAQLAVSMYSEMDKGVNPFQAINTLIYCVNTQEDFLAIGLFDEDKLVGCTFGHKFQKNVFYFCGIHVIMKNNKWTKKIIDFSFATIKEKGYTSWLVDTTNNNIGSIMQKYNAQHKYTRYQGEL
jgi:hypothetical protein